MANAFIIFHQMLIMFIYMGIGFALYKKELISREGSRGLANLLLYVILPSVIVKSFCAERDAQTLRLFPMSVLMGAGLLLLSMGVAAVFFKKRPIDNFGAAFSNAGFMGIPLISAIAGQRAVLYTAGMVAFLNIFQWFYGQSVLSGKKMELKAGILMKNPLIVSFCAGTLLFFLNINLPALILEPIQALSALNAPVAMIILGIYLAQTDFRQLFRDKGLYLVSAVRLAVIPLCSLLVLGLFRSAPYDLKIALLIAASAPVGSNVAVYSQKLNKDYIYAVKTVCLSTLLSILTMPACIYAAERLWG